MEPKAASPEETAKYPSGETLLQAHFIQQSLVHVTPLAFTVILCMGVKLYLDWEEEILFLEVSPIHSRRIFQAAVLVIEALGLEIMDDDECPPEVMPNGATRLWLAANDPAVALACAY